MNTPVCEGACEQHEGDCRKVRVTDLDGYDWGFFWYCDEAKRTDSSNGMIVEDVEDK